MHPTSPCRTSVPDGSSNIVQSAWDAAYYAVVLDALTNDGPAEPRRIDRAVCTEAAMPGVDAVDAVLRSAALYAVIGQRQQAHPKVPAEPALKPYVVVGAEAGRTVFGKTTTPSGTREYMLHVPPGAQKGRPLVVYLHGCSERNDAAAVASGYNRLASKENFYVVYPDQPADANGNKCWNWFIPDHQHRGTGEPGIIAAITRSVIRRYAIDSRRVFVTGISAGGAMANVMAATYPELWAAVGAEAGAQYRGYPCVSVPCVVPPETSAQWAYEEMGTRARQIPFFAIVGDIDAVSPAENTERSVRMWLGIDDLVDNGADDGTVARSPQSTREGAVRGGYTLLDRPICITRLRHRRALARRRDEPRALGRSTRIRTTPDPKGPDAAAASWRFFAAHPKQDARVLTCGAPPSRP